MPRVVVYAPYSAPGDPALCAALLAAEIPTTYLCTGPRLVDDLPAGIEIKHLPVEEPIQRTSILGRLTASRERYKINAHKVTLLRDLLQSVRPSHLIAGDIELGVPLALEARDWVDRSIRVLGLSHGSDVYSVPKRSVLQAAQIVEALVRCDGVIGFSRAHLRDIALLSDDAIDARDMLAIGAWIDLEHFAPPKLDQRKSEPLVLCLRGEREVYRSYLVKNAAGLVDQEIPLTLRMAVADGWEDDLYWTQQIKRGHFEAVSERIPHSEMPQEYARADVVMQALARESLGYSTLEAMACGRALVQIDTPLARELMPAENFPFLAQEGRSEEVTLANLAHALKSLLRDHAIRRHLEAVNRQWAEQHFDARIEIPKAAKRLVEWLAKIS